MKNFKFLVELFKELDIKACLHQLRNFLQITLLIIYFINELTSVTDGIKQLIKEDYLLGFVQLLSVLEPFLITLSVFWLLFFIPSKFMEAFYEYKEDKEKRETWRWTALILSNTACMFFDFWMISILLLYYFSDTSIPLWLQSTSEEPILSWMFILVFALRTLYIQIRKAYWDGGCLASISKSRIRDELKDTKASPENRVDKKQNP